MNKLFCSSGVMVGRINGNDYTLITKYFPSLLEKGLIDGGEFMFASSFYDKLNEICTEISKSNVPFDVIHCDKEIGIMLSECDDNISKIALGKLEANCAFAREIGARCGVFHLWGGLKSDLNIDYNISYLDRILSIFERYKIELLIENIPSVKYSGLENWLKIEKEYPDISYIFDTRFGAFHDEINNIFSNQIWEKVKHIHISDYSSYPRNFEKIRPILHPGEGVIDFEHVFSMLKWLNYTGTFTIESPVMSEGYTDICKLEKTLSFVKNNI